MKTFFSGLLILVDFLISNAAYAVQTISVVDANNCQLVNNAQAPFMLVLKKGENLRASLLHCIETAHIKSAAVMGIGAALNPRIAYFNMDTKQYQYKTFPGIYELLSLTGNISQLNGKPFAHLHVVLGQSDYTTIGGHLDDMQVGAVAEFTILPFAQTIVRKFDPATGLQVISTTH